MLFVSTSHQKVVLEIDFSGALWGYTDITIVPATSDLKTIYLHSRQCTIHSVTVGGHQADFAHHDPLANISMGNAAEAQDCHRHPELKRKIYSALQECDEGELAIAIPAEVRLERSGHSGGGSSFRDDAATPEPQGPSSTHQSAQVEFAPLIVNITYSLRNPADGFEFVLPSDTYPFRVPHAYTTPSSPDAARCWVPCIDNLWEKCTWEFEFVVPRFLEERAPGSDEDELLDAMPTVVVCSGELIEQIAHPYNSNKTIFLYSQAILTSVQHIAFAAGPFHVRTIPVDVSNEEPSGSSQPLMQAFCLPGHEGMLDSSIACLRSAMSFYSSEFGSYPFGAFRILFVDQMPTQRFDASTLCLVTTDLLHGDDNIEQGMETRHALSHALACQWSGINIIPKSWSDLWLVNGLALHITGLFMRKLFGLNDYRFKLKKDMQRVISWDVGGMPPICQPQVLDPPDAATLPFINLKAPLVLHILDRKLGKSGTSLGLSRVLPKIFLSAISGELPNNALSTHTFLRMCRKVSGVDLRTFAEQWIYGSGCPSFGFQASFNRKKMAVEITMRQECPAYMALENSEVSKVLLKPVPFFEGQMTIRIHEADGTPYEHVLDIRSPFKRYEVPFNTKYKRVRRNTKRYLARQAAAQAAAEGDAEAAEAMGMIDMGFGLEIWEKEQERENWKVVDWTEEDEQVMSGATYEWIRMDADFEWIASIKFEQPDFMWVSQLQRDRDVVAQMEAISALAEKPTAIVSSTLTKAVLVTNYFYRIRSEAAVALVQCAIRKLDFLGLFHLFKLFLRYCYDPEDPDQDLFTHKYVPKPNDFSDFAEYFVRKSLISAISQVRFENGKTPSVVRQFLIDQLRFNDNTSNPYSDGFYICTIISAATAAVISTSPPERGELLPTESRVEHTPEDLELVKQIRTEVDRYRSMDRLIPSPHNIVTIAALEFYMVLGTANLIPIHPKVFFPLTRDGNYTQVRIAAFDGLFMSKWYTPPIMSYVLAVMAHDSSRLVRRHVARSACYSLALLAQMGEMKSTAKESETLLIEEDGNSHEKMKENKKSELDAMIKVLRKDREIGKNEVLREFLMPVALMPDVDHEVRWCLLKLADLLLRAVEETPPSVKIHIPSTPIVETAPQLPSVKVVTKTRAIKTGGPPIKSPLVPFNAPKLKVTEPRQESSPATPTVRRPSVVVRDVPRRSESVALSDVAPNPPKQKIRPPVPQKPIHKTSVLKAQTGGMSANDLKACRAALKRLRSNKHATVFLQPVDPIRDHAPNYFEVIKDPMDLSTMAAKLEEGMYKDRFAFQADFQLMIANAKTYNMPESFVHSESVALETAFEKQWAAINHTLEVASKNAPPPPPEPIPPPKPATRVVLPPSKPTPRPSPAPQKPAAPSAVSTPVPSSTSARPMIKLKVGGSGPPAKPPPKASPSAPAPAPVSAPSVATIVKPTKRKAKPQSPLISPEAPPPPYVDDGSHDILQEVLAIEREQSEQRQRSFVDKDKPGLKRKKVDLLDEDDILALATPSKKDRPTPPSVASGSKPTVALSSRASSSKPSAPSVKISARPPEPRTAHASPVPPATASLKGKERAINHATPTPPPTNVAKRAVAQTPFQKSKCKELLKTLLRVPEAQIFAIPVDPVLHGCPTYYDEIKHPMDFGTMMNKVNDSSYSTMEDFKKDVELVFANCRQFNIKDTYPWICADIVEKVFKKEWPKAMERKLAWQEKRGLQGVLSKIMKEPVALVFLDPVDPIALGIPTYFDVIPKRDARDLKTIRQKLEVDKYDSVEAFEADIDLMINNAIKFNGVDSDVGLIAVQMRRRMNELMSSWKVSNNKKRKEEQGQSQSQPVKKAKTG